MGRYDSPLSVVTLFLVATVASVGLIYLIDAESESRLVKLGKKSPHSSPAIRSFQPDDNKEVGDSTFSSTTTGGFLPDEVKTPEEKTTPAGAGGKRRSVLGYFGDKLKDLFKRHHSVSKRSVADNNEESKMEEEDEDVENPQSEAAAAEYPQKMKRSARIDGRDGNYEDIYNRHNGGHNTLGDKHSGGAVPGPIMPASPSSPLITPPAFTSSSSSGFHKIRHAIKKLDGGGLDLSMVERMILDTNPGRFRSSSEHQEMERKSNYHVVPYSSGGGSSSSSASSTIGSHTNNNHKIPDKFGFHQHQNHHSDVYGYGGQQQQSSRSGGDSQQPPPPSRPQSLGKEKLDVSTMNASRDKNIPASSSSSSDRRKGDGKPVSTTTSSSSRIELFSNRNWNGNNHNSNDNENDNGIQHVTKVSTTTTTEPAPLKTTTMSESSSGGGRQSSKVGNSLGHHHKRQQQQHQQHHHGKGRNSSNARTHGNIIRQRKKASTPTPSSSSSSPPPLPSSYSLFTAIGVEDANESSDFGGVEQQEGLNEKRRKTNHTDSRSGSFPGFVITKSHHEQHPVPESSESNYHHHRRRILDNNNNNDRHISSLAVPHEKDDDGGSVDNGDERHQKQEYQNVKQLGKNNQSSRNRLSNAAGSGAEENNNDGLWYDEEGKEQSNSNSLPSTTVTTFLTDTKRSILKEDVPICYKTDDVLIVVAITCCLNFAFVLVVWGCVRWFSISSTSKERDFHHLDCEDGGESVIFHEDHDHEDCCWRPGSPINFERETKCEHAVDCLDMTHGVHCRESRRRNSGGHCNKFGSRGGGEEDQIILPTAVALGMADLNVSKPLTSTNTTSAAMTPFFPTCAPFCDSGSLSGRISSLRRKPSDRFHFYRQKQYQKNLREFGLGFGPPLLSSSSNMNKSTGMPKASASMHCFRKPDVPQQLHQALKNRHKFCSHSMEDLRYLHT